MTTKTKIVKYGEKEENGVWCGLDGVDVEIYIRDGKLDYGTVIDDPNDKRPIVDIICGGNCSKCFLDCIKPAAIVE